MKTTVTGFTIGSGGAALKARALPENTKVKIAQVGVIQSTFKQTIQKGPRKGEEIPRHQLKVVYEALEDGETLEYKKGKGKKRETIPAEPFETGDHFAQYLGGVYPKDNGGVTLTEEGSAFTFVDMLEEAGIESTGDFDDYVGIVCEIQHLKGRGPMGPYVQAMPGAVVGHEEPDAEEASEEDDEEETAEEADSDDADPFMALSLEDRQAILDSQEDGITAEELVDAGMADDEEHAEEILAHIPALSKKKAKPKAKPKKKAAKKRAAKKKTA